jgi:hypothetical protein
MKIIFILFLFYFRSIESANILFLLPVPSASHRLWNNVLIEGLAERGHNLTILTVERENSRPNVTYICIRNVYESLDEFFATKGNESYYNIDKRRWSVKIIMQDYRFMNFVSQKIFNSSAIKVLRDYPRNFQFHAIIFDFSMAQSLLTFVEHFNFPPLISISPLSRIPPRLNAASSAQIFPAYVPHYSSTSTSKSLREQITERFMNAFIYHTFDWFYAKYVYMKNENRRLAKLFGGENRLQLELLEYSDLVIINRNFAYDEVLPLPPNVIPVAGLQAQRRNEIQNDVSWCHLHMLCLLLVAS